MIAYMIACHKLPMQVVRLARILSTNQSDVFVHCDAKMPDSDFHQIVSQLNIGGVYLTNSRLSGHLDDRSLVDISLLLIKKAKEVENLKKCHYKYFALVSGQDYAIKNINIINSNILGSYPKPLLDCNEYSRSNWIFYKFNKRSWVIKLDREISKLRRRSVLRVACRAFTITCSKILQILHLSDMHVLRRKGVSLYGGSAWWALPDRVVDFIAAEYEGEISQRLLGTYTPEETYFQTMTMRTHLAEMVDINPPGYRGVRGACTWVLFQDEGKPFMGHPYNFDISYLNRLLDSNFYFARKFDMTYDSQILDNLDCKCCNTNSS